MTDTATATVSRTTAFTVSPDDAAQALRMGWILAELHGRLDPACDHSPAREMQPPLPPEPPEPPALLLDTANERSAVERQIEATKVLSTLGSLNLTKVDLKTLSRSDKWGPVPTGGPALKTPDMLRYLVCRLIVTNSPHAILDIEATLTTRPVTDGDRETTSARWWERVEWFLWAWDEALQDQLAAGKFGTASAYELGRGLSESYWALNPDHPGYEHHWDFLLGPGRVQALRSLSKRLAPVFSEYTAPAIAESVKTWGDVAANPGAYDEPLNYLRRQVGIWRDLLVTGRDPLTLVEPSELEAVARDPRPILKAFGWELIAALVLAAGLALSLTYFSNQARAVVAALTAVGISASAIVSWIKSRAQSVANRVGSAVDQSVVNDAVTVAPPLTHPRRRFFLPLDHPR